MVRFTFLTIAVDASTRSCTSANKPETEPQVRATARTNGSAHEKRNDRTAGNSELTSARSGITPKVTAFRMNVVSHVTVPGSVPEMRLIVSFRLNENITQNTDATVAMSRAMLERLMTLRG